MSLSSPSLPTVSVVVATYNRSAGLRALLTPLLEDGATTEVVVVVDGSPDDSAELLRAWAVREPRLRVVVTENRGAMYARQRGLEEARGEVVLLLDDDVVARPGLVEGHARRQAEGSGRELVLGYMPIPPEGQQGLATRLYAEEYERHCEALEREGERVLTHLWMGNLSLPREAALQVGFLSPRLPKAHGRWMKHEDRDFGLRARSAGLRGVFDRRLEAEHHHQRSIRAWLRDAYQQGADRRALERIYGAELTSAAPRSSLARTLLPLLAHPGLRTPLFFLLLPLVERLPGERLPRMLGRLLRRIELYRGEVVERAAEETRGETEGEAVEEPPMWLPERSA